MTGSDYNVALFVFFIPYILLEVPSNLVLKRVAPSTWLAGIMVLWGVCTVGQGVVRGFGGLVGMRVLVGGFEAGLFPGMFVCCCFFSMHPSIYPFVGVYLSIYLSVYLYQYTHVHTCTHIHPPSPKLTPLPPGCMYLISMYYHRYELQLRFTLFFSASILAGAFGGLLAFLLAKLDGVGSYSGWRWIFIIEGLLTVVVGVAAKFWVPDWPETASFLSDDERALLVARLAAETGPARMDRLDKRAAKRIVRDVKMWLGTVMYFGIVNTGYAGSFFIPSIIRELGYTAAAAQVRSIPIFVVAAVAAVGASYLTDRMRHRFWFIMFGLIVASVGYILLLCGARLSAGVKYFALFLIVPGGYIAQPIVLVWVSNLMSGHYKRSVSSAVQVGLGNIGGIVASNVFFESEAKNARYPTGYGVSLGMLWICGVASVVLLFYVKRENRRRDRGERDYRLEEEDSENLGDDHPHFRFTT